MTSLVILGGPENWELVIRHHDLGGTEYEHICCIPTYKAYTLVDHCGVSFLYGDPRLRESQK